MSDESDVKWWSADEVDYTNGVININGVVIPGVESALSLTSFCKKLEKLNFNFNFNLQNVVFQNKEDCDSFLKSLNKLRFPKNTDYTTILFSIDRSRLNDVEEEVDNSLEQT